MEQNVSPLMKSQSNSIPDKPLLDDPYAYVTHMDPLTRHEFYYILRKIEQGWITERDIQIVQFLFVHRWVTLRQLSKLFFPTTEREGTVRSRVRKLAKYGLLRKIQWTSYSNPKENRPSLYELGASGADILKYRFGTFLGQRDPRVNKQTTMLFRCRYITTNELYIQLRESFNLIHFEFHPVLKIEDEQQVPTAKYTLKHPSGNELSFYLLCYRDDEKWLKTLRYQAAFFKKYLATVEAGVFLVILVSTSDKAEIAHKVLLQEGVKDTWFVTDDDLYNEQIRLTQGFFVFQNEQKTYYDLET